MHIVYLFKFKRNQLPNLYIGSKSNCYIKEGKIFDKKDKLYEGSCDSDMYLEALSKCNYEVFILGEFEVYNDALSMERDAHIANDVVASPNYFNRSIANVNSYTNPEYATYKNVLTGKVARLPRIHPEVLNGNWVGVTKGTIFTEEERLCRGRSGEKNAFYGKSHTIKTKNDISDKVKGKTKGVPKTQTHKDNISSALSGVKKSDAHKMACSKAHKGTLTVKNILTGEIQKVEKIIFDTVMDKDVWATTSSFQKREICIYCGKESVVGNIKRWHNDNCKEKKI